MLLTEEQTTQRLNSPDNLSLRFGSVQVNQAKKLGRPPQAKNLPRFVHDTAAFLARSTDETQESIGKSLGMNQNAVSDCKNGKIKTSEQLIEDALAPIRQSAITKLTDSFLSMTPDKIANAKLPELGKFASDMSRVIEKTLPKEKQEGDKIQIVFMTPQQMSEESFQVVEVTKG